MSKKQVPTIIVNRVMDSRRTATEAFLELIYHDAKNQSPIVETQSISDYNMGSVTQAASQEVK